MSTDDTLAGIYAEFAPRDAPGQPATPGGEVADSDVTHAIDVLTFHGAVNAAAAVEQMARDFANLRTAFDSEDSARRTAEYHREELTAECHRLRTALAASEEARKAAERERNEALDDRAAAIREWTRLESAIDEHLPPCVLDDGSDSGANERERVECAGREIRQLRVARLAYASELPSTPDGKPDVGSIHENLRALKADRDRLAADLLTIAQGAGIVYEADGHATAPGPVAAIVEQIREDRERAERLAADLATLRAKLAAAEERFARLAAEGLRNHDTLTGKLAAAEEREAKARCSVREFVNGLDVLAGNMDRENVDTPFVTAVQMVADGLRALAAPPESQGGQPATSGEK